jgi:hypothetical protein
MDNRIHNELCILSQYWIYLVTIRQLPEWNQASSPRQGVDLEEVSIRDTLHILVSNARGARETYLHKYIASPSPDSLAGPTLTYLTLEGEGKQKRTRYPPALPLDRSWIASLSPSGPCVAAWRHLA